MSASSVNIIKIRWVPVDWGQWLAAHRMKFSLFKEYYKYQEIIESNVVHRSCEIGSFWVQEKLQIYKLSHISTEKFSGTFAQWNWKVNFIRGYSVPRHFWNKNRISKPSKLSWMPPRAFRTDRRQVIALSIFYRNFERYSSLPLVRGHIFVSNNFS